MSKHKWWPDCNAIPQEVKGRIFLYQEIVSKRQKQNKNK